MVAHETSASASIPWSETLDAAREKAAARQQPVLIYASGAPECGESVAFEAVTLAEARVADALGSQVVPFRFRPQDEPGLAGELGVAATPAVLLTDANGKVCYRIDGFVAADALLERLELGLGLFECGLLAPLAAPQPTPHLDAAPSAADGSNGAAEALYWKAAARFRKTGDTRRLRADWQQIAARFPHSVWALRMRLVPESRQAG